ncbi:MAG: PHP-associated domain-containing protein, partial [Gemmatimonadota bacterium]|nr:PHP-associated domain-containing protein [Gemmatimonadota bacterium]
NTAGWDKPCGEQYPALEIIRRAVDKGVRITAGSDAHAPEEVGRYFGRLKAILGQVGVTRLVGFEKLEAVEIEL